MRSACLDDSLRPLILQLLTYKVDLSHISLFYFILLSLCCFNLYHLLFIYFDHAYEKVYMRRTITKITRNLCFGEKFHKILINQINIIPILLAPLRGPEDLSDEDKTGLHPSLYPILLCLC